MYQFFKHHPLKKQADAKQVKHLLKERLDKTLRHIAAYLNRKTIQWNKRRKFCFLLSICLFFVLSLVLLFFSKPDMPATKGMAGPVIIKLTIPPDNPRHLPPAVLKDSNRSGKTQKKPP